MLYAPEPSFKFSTPEIDVERAVSELRYGRPIVLSSNERKMAVLALDAIAPSIYDQFAAVCVQTHSLLLTAPRASRLGIAGKQDIVTPLAGVNFEAASRLSYALGAAPPSKWVAADALASQSAELAEMSQFPDNLSVIAVSPGLQFKVSGVSESEA